jgi:hypothetical protein
MAERDSTIRVRSDEPTRLPVEFREVSGMCNVSVPKRSEMVHTLEKSALDNYILDNRTSLN